MNLYCSQIIFALSFLYLPPAYGVQREGDVLSLSVCSPGVQGEEYHDLWRQVPSWGRGYLSQVLGQDTTLCPAKTSTGEGGAPQSSPRSGYPPPPPTALAMDRMGHWRYASCSHAGGLSFLYLQMI